MIFAMIPRMRAVAISVNVTAPIVSSKPPIPIIRTVDIKTLGLLLPGLSECP